MAHLTRAWSMLLKGIREAELHSEPLMAAEMVLIRLAYAADLPGGEDLAKLVKQAPQGERVVPMSARELLRNTSESPVESQAALAVKPQVTAPSSHEPTRAFSTFADLLALATDSFGTT